jgi:hypothetical protein
MLINGILIPNCLDKSLLRIPFETMTWRIDMTTTILNKQFAAVVSKFVRFYANMSSRSGLH